MEGQSITLVRRLQDHGYGFNAERFGQPRHLLEPGHRWQFLETVAEIVSFGTGADTSRTEERPLDTKVAGGLAGRVGDFGHALAHRLLDEHPAVLLGKSAGVAVPAVFRHGRRFLLGGRHVLRGWSHRGDGCQRRRGRLAGRWRRDMGRRGWSGERRLFFGGGRTDLGSLLFTLGRRGDVLRLGRQRGSDRYGCSALGCQFRGLFRILRQIGILWNGCAAVRHQQRQENRQQNDQRGARDGDLGAPLPLGMGFGSERGQRHARPFATLEIPARLFPKRGVVPMGRRQQRFAEQALADGAEPPLLACAGRIVLDQFRRHGGPRGLDHSFSAGIDLRQRAGAAPSGALRLQPAEVENRLPALRPGQRALPVGRPGEQVLAGQQQVELAGERGRLIVEPVQQAAEFAPQRRFGRRIAGKHRRAQLPVELHHRGRLHGRDHGGEPVPERRLAGKGFFERAIEHCQVGGRDGAGKVRQGCRFQPRQDIHQPWHRGSGRRVGPGGPVIPQPGALRGKRALGGKLTRNGRKFIVAGDRIELQNWSQQFAGKVFE